MNGTKIEWTDATWNPIRGCSHISPGCVNCYAEKVAARFSGPGLAYDGLTHSTGAWNGRVTLVEHLLTWPIRTRRPRRIFVNSMSDLFHENVPDEWIDRIFAVMARAEHHTFQVLTKRPRRMYDYLTHPGLSGRILRASHTIAFCAMSEPPTLPLPNVWLGVSVEDQDRADERIPLLLRTPAALRFLSCEPLLECINLRLLRGQPFDLEGAPRRAHWIDACTGEHGCFLGLAKAVFDDRLPRVDWVIVGGESGPGARPIRVVSVRAIVNQCRMAGVPVFVKQLGANVYDLNDAGFDGNDLTSWPEGTVAEESDMYQGAPCRIRLRHPRGGDPDEWPRDLRVREFPKVV